MVAPGHWAVTCRMCWRRGSPGYLQGCWCRLVIWENQNDDAIGMKWGLLVLCIEESAAEAAFFLPEQGWELTLLAGDKPAPCRGLGSSRSFSSSCLKVKHLMKVRAESVLPHAGDSSHVERSHPWLGSGCRVHSLPECGLAQHWVLEEAPPGLAVLFSLVALWNPGSRLWLSGFLCPHS